MTQQSPRGARRARAAHQATQRYQAQVLLAEAMDSELPAILAFIENLYAQRPEATNLLPFIVGG